MEDDSLTPQQQQARMYFAQAMEQAKRGHLERAIELGEQAIEYDPRYLECRRWLAASYEKIDEPRLASRHLQEILHANHDDAEAWAALERVDPGAAARLKRVREIGPDPFVARRQRTAEELAEFEEFDELMEEGVVQEEFSEDRLVPSGEAEALVEDMEQVAEEFVEELPPSGQRHEFAALGEEEEPEAPGEEGRVVTKIGEPQPWEHEEDRPYRDKMLADPVLHTIVERVRESWEEPDSWRPVLDVCAHASKDSHKELWDAVNAASATLRAPVPVVLIVPEGSPHMLPLRESELELAFNTGLMRCMEGTQLAFTAARGVAMLLSGAVAFYHAALLTTDRPARELGQCEEATKEFLWDLTGAWFESQPKDQRQHAAALAHAWEMRCVLSCDRAGLLVCGNEEAACNAIARSCCRTAAQAQQMNWRSLLEKYKGQDLSKLAAIPVKELPWHSEAYAVYRIQMLRWWFRTDQYRELAGKYRAD